MNKHISLKDAVARFVKDGQTIALEGFTHLIPFAAGHEIIRQGRRDLTLVRMTPDILYDQMIGMGCRWAYTSPSAACQYARLQDAPGLPAAKSARAGHARGKGVR